MLDSLQKTRVWQRTSAKVLAACVLSLSCIDGTAQAQTTNIKGAILNFGANQYIVNNEWGAIKGGGSESVTVQSPTRWSTSYDWKRIQPLGVRAYPSSVLGWSFGTLKHGTGLPVQLASHTAIKSTVAFQITGNAMQDIAYDCWFHNTSTPGKNTKPTDEMMIWEAAYNGPGPIGVPVASMVIDGHPWKLYQGTNSFGWNVHTFVIQTKPLSGASLNLSDFTDYLVSHRDLSSTLYIDGIAFGTEVVYGSGTMNVSHYTCTVQPRSSGQSHGQ